MRLLRAVRRAMRPDSRLLVIEPMDEPGGSEIAHRFDLAMLVMKGSGARTRAALDALLRDAGLTMTGVVPTLMFPVVEVSPR